MGTRIEYRPNWAKHCIGIYQPRSFDPETGELEEQKIELTCEKCGTVAKATCKRGNPREHVAHFAIAHLHKDPFK